MAMDILVLNLSAVTWDEQKIMGHVKIFLKVANPMSHDRNK